MIKNFYRVDGPAIISFSGGRTSGYMLYHILEAFDGKLPDDIKVAFANTGKEMPQTLDFVQRCSREWNVSIVWLEYKTEPNKDKLRHTYITVDYNSASRNGEPFAMLIKARKSLPFPVARMCTQDLKVRPIEKFCKDVGLVDFYNIVGLRADEPRRVSNIRKSPELKGCLSREVPLADMGVTVQDVSDFWKAHSFDLELENINGSTPMGNCDLCFLKNLPKISGIIRDNPELADWWIQAEHMIPHKNKPNGFMTFRTDRPSYENILKMTKQQGDLFKNMPEEDTISCMCTD